MPTCRQRLRVIIDRLLNIVGLPGHPCVNLRGVEGLKMQNVEIVELAGTQVNVATEVTLANTRTGEDGVSSTAADHKRVTRFRGHVETATDGRFELLLDGQHVSSIPIRVAKAAVNGIELDIDIPVGSKLQVVQVQTEAGADAIEVALEVRKVA